MCLLIFAVAQCARAQRAITLAWEPNDEPDLAGYFIHYGLASGAYSTKTNVGLRTTNTISGLLEGLTYYFAVTAYNTAGLESEPSNEITNRPNRRPVLSVPDHCHPVNVGQPLIVTNTASDQDVPSQTLTFSVAGPPFARARINPASGIFTWWPAPQFAGSTQYFTITVTDDGSPPASETKSFCAIINDYFAVEVGSMITRVREDADMPLTLLSSAAVTNLCFTLQYPENRLANLSLVYLNPLLCSGTITPVSSNIASLCFNTCPGQALVGAQTIAFMRVTTLVQNSGFVPFRILAAAAAGPAARPISHVATPQPRGVVIANEPLLEADQGTNGTILLTVYGKPGVTYQILSATNIWPMPTWQSTARIVLPGLFHQLQLPTSTQLDYFFSAREVQGQ